MSGMSNWIQKILGAIAGVLLFLLGIERRRNKKQKEKIVKQQEQVAYEKKQAEIYRVESETVKKSTKLDEPVEEQRKVEEKINKTDETEEIIDIANDIVSRFNRVPDNPGTTED
ncbi:MAG: hypothetical protein PQJ48_05415 [Sphaerochaetaceae bacterium]|nr:hypothetical protein [Sphaerochaetaceae bacterium]